MGRSYDIIQHTRKLLEQGVFNHLSDDTISILHHMIMQAPESQAEKKSFFNIWRKGDFTSSFLTMQLLQQSNYMLQFYGEAIINEDFMEFVFD
jgi:hypothetical protein